MTDDLPFAELFRHAEVAYAGAAADAVQVPIGFLNDLSQATTKDEVLSAYSLWCQQIVKADRCSIGLDGDNETLTLTAMSGSKAIAPDTQYDIANTVVGAVYQHWQPIYAPDIKGIESPGLQTLARLGYTALITVPLRTKTRCFGVINASFIDHLTQPGTVIGTLQAIGQCLAMQLQVVEQMDSLSELVRTDVLTGAGNRRLLYERAEVMWAQWRNAAQTFCYMAVDIDHFKQINDTYGHDVGDAVLSTFSNRIRSRLRKDDTFIRTGGEEFGVLMAGTDITQATHLATRLCDVVGETPFSIDDLPLFVTASFGLTNVDPKDRSIEAVLKRADVALYQAKAGGRDQVIALTEPDLAA